MSVERLVLRVKVERFRAGDALERPKERIPAQTIFGAVIGATVELLKGQGEEVTPLVEELAEGLRLTDAFPVNREGEPLLPTPHPVEDVFKDPDLAEENLGVDVNVHRIPDPPENVPLRTFLRALDDPESTAVEVLETRVEAGVATSRVTHASVPRTGDDTTPFTQGYAVGDPGLRVTHVAFLEVERDLMDTLKAALRYLEDLGIGGARTRGAGEVPLLELREPRGPEKGVFDRIAGKGEPAVTLSACLPEGDGEFQGEIERRGLHYVRIGPYVTQHRVPRIRLAATGSRFPSWPGARNETLRIDPRFVPPHLRDDPDYRDGFTVYVYGKGFPVKSTGVDR